MKHVNIDDILSDIFKKHGAFFAFSDKQFEESRKDGVSYANMGAGMVAPVDSVSALSVEINNASKERIRKTLELNTIEEIIHYELGNFECQISCDPSDAFASLSAYGITEDQVRAEYPKFMDKCVEMDLF